MSENKYTMALANALAETEEEPVNAVNCKEDLVEAVNAFLEEEFEKRDFIDGKEAERILGQVWAVFYSDDLEIPEEEEPEEEAPKKRTKKKTTKKTGKKTPRKKPGAKVPAEAKLKKMSLPKLKALHLETFGEGVRGPAKKETVIDKLLGRR